MRQEALPDWDREPTADALPESSRFYACIYKSIYAVYTEVTKREHVASASKIIESNRQT
jgi:hypothetical protein